jgi:hypothetical protein
MRVFSKLTSELQFEGKIIEQVKGKAVPLHAMEALGGEEV